MESNLGDRMKDYYENRTRLFLPRRTHTVIRLDGKAFSTFTKHFRKPFDAGLTETFNRTVCLACSQIQGVKLGYYQSDEISLILTDFDDLKTEAWFDGNLQKIVSVSASIVTGIFNSFLSHSLNHTMSDAFNMERLPAAFDSRVFTIPETDEVINYLIWRQRDCTRNSILGLGYSKFSHKQLLNKNTTEIIRMLKQEGVKWEDLDPGLKYGHVIFRKTYELEHKFDTYYNKAKLENKIIRSKWISIPAPVFTEDRELSFLEDRNWLSQMNPTK